MWRLILIVNLLVGFGAADWADASPKGKRRKQNRRRGRGVAKTIPALVAPKPLHTKTMARILPLESKGKPKLKKTAAQKADRRTPLALQSPTTSPSSLQPYAVLLGLLACIGAVGLMIKRSRGKNYERGETVDVVASRTVTPKVRVVVLRNRNREFLLSVSDRGATLLSEWIAEPDAEPEVPTFTIEPPVVSAPDRRMLPARAEPATLTGPATLSPALSGLFELREESREQA